MFFDFIFTFQAMHHHLYSSWKTQQLYLSYWSRGFWFAIIFLLKAFDIHIWLFLPRPPEVASLKVQEKSLRPLVKGEKCCQS